MEIDFDLWDDDFTDWKFHSMLCEMEANGKILEQWEMGAPVVDNRETAQKIETKTNENEKRNIIQ